MGAIRERNDQWREETKARILELIPEYSTFKLVCLEVGIAQKTFFEWRNNDKQFDLDVREAREERIGKLEQALEDWALNGKVTKRYDPKSGELVSEIVEPCERLLIAALAANRPEKYGSKPEGDGIAVVPMVVVPATMDHSNWAQMAIAQQQRSEIIEAEALEKLGEKKREVVEYDEQHH